VSISSEEVQAAFQRGGGRQGGQSACLSSKSKFMALGVAMRYVRNVVIAGVLGAIVSGGARAFG
jgi:hypothetical protein